MQRRDFLKYSVALGVASGFAAVEPRSLCGGTPNVTDP